VWPVVLFKRAYATFDTEFTSVIYVLSESQPTNQPTTELTEGGDLRESEVDVRRSVQPFLRLPHH
jgi:hypothetical protein